MNYKSLPLSKTFYLPDTFKARFRNAAKGHLPARQWVRDVFETFADNAHLQVSQAVMLFITDRIDRAAKMHEVAASKLASEGHNNSDEYRYLTELANMPPSDHMAFIRKAFDSALNINYGG